MLRISETNIESHSMTKQQNPDIDAQAKVLVCDQCLTASCWHGIFMCDDARSAGLKVVTVADLRALPESREHEDNWSDETMIKIYGNADRNFTP